jgi:hypothetical protein
MNVSTKKVFGIALMIVGAGATLYGVRCIF